MELKNYLARFKEFSSEAIHDVDSIFSCECYHKGHKLFLPGNCSRNVFFFEKGLARLYYLKDGREITHFFFAENSFPSSIEGIFYNQPTPYGLEVLEPSTIRTISYPELQKYLNNSISAERFIRILLIEALATLSDRLHAIQFQSAQERYSIMLEKYPNIFSRAPLGHIASYLGITQETLSRIRSAK